MRIRAQARGGDPEHDFPWASAIRFEMESWHPQGLPERFRPRRGAGGTLRSAPPALRAAWKPVALAVAFAAVGSLAFSLIPTPAGVSPVVPLLTESRPGVVPTPNLLPALTPPSPVTTHVPTPARVTRTPVPVVATPAGPPAPAQATPSSRQPTPTPLTSDLPTSLPTPPPTPLATPAQTPATTSADCVLHILCV